MANELTGEQLDFLHDLVPSVTTIAYLAGGQQFASEQEDTSNLLAAGQALREVIVLDCRSASDLDAALATLEHGRAGALIVGLFPLAWTNRRRIIALAARHKIPAIYPSDGFARAGGLMSYSAAHSALLRQVAADYVGKILKGARPADLPVQRPTKFELVINLADREGPRHRHSADAACHRRRGDRVRRREFITPFSAARRPRGRSRRARSRASGCGASAC